MLEKGPLKALEPLQRQSVADTVFETLYRQILSLDLPPATKMSEAEVAKALGVSRQPVRDAFYRLSKLGFLLIRPQRATTVTQISESAVYQARFVRNAIEVQTVQVACDTLTSTDLAALDGIMNRQKQAVEELDPETFHRYDDLFHKEICERSGLEFAWDIIRENKAHMDRVRFLSLSFASRDAFEDHIKVLDALKSREKTRAVEAMTRHLARIKEQLPRIRRNYEEFFVNEASSD
ncbi:GntR family transcriptional regulator [Roseibium litorale]|uniref:GntR family transcriptional regulator n=1 Tax=Roseibium litorale TaxID=2803841 RepID=A0ABR9CJW3_9HYPH|nr:GntR family transcriptional regulator [Roseibium litorale]MBD8891128.1 GntR family transcriptional regulator [Roseibium litorale]